MGPITSPAQAGTARALISRGRQRKKDRNEKERKERNETGGGAGETETSSEEPSRRTGPRPEAWDNPGAHITR